MTGFLRYYTGVATRPSVYLRLLTRDERMLQHAFKAVGVSALLYTFVYIFLVIGGGLPFKPWLNINPEVYYRYNVFFCAPSMFLGWILAAGVMHLLGNRSRGGGSFERTLAVTGFAISIGSWATGVHDVVTSALGAFHIIDQRSYEISLNTPTIWRTLLWLQMIIYVIAFIFFFSVGTRIVYRTSGLRSLLIGLTGFIIYQLFFLIFNR